MERRRYAQQRFDALEDASIADGMEQGQEYIPPPNSPKPEGRIKVERFVQRREHWLRQAQPELFTPAAVRARYEAEQDAAWGDMERAG